MNDEQRREALFQAQPIRAEAVFRLAALSLADVAGLHGTAGQDAPMPRSPWMGESGRSALPVQKNRLGRVDDIRVNRPQDRLLHFPQVILETRPTLNAIVQPEYRHALDPVRIVDIANVDRLEVHCRDDF